VGHHFHLVRYHTRSGARLGGKERGRFDGLRSGQVSLDPLPHIKREPLGMVVFPLISSFILGWPFGYAKTPYDPSWAYIHPRKAAWMAAAGPAANLLLAVFCALVVKVGILNGIFIEPDSVGLTHIVDPVSGSAFAGLAIFISMMFNLNLIMVVLNLIPLPPLDGSSIITLFLDERVARGYRSVITNPMFGFIGLFIAWQVFSPLIDVVFPLTMNILYWGAGFH
jgi:Zn-dependent protease